ncbi:mitochondrial ribosomal protein S6 [Rhodnius prolixus]|uniref:Small ribosomal subunit protein bS6m n=1 Tax=Rhodnius prolixus TaxID=13249 RepID=R4FPJ3_RHOPR
MITYELALLLRVMPKPELKTVLKRTAASIFDKGGIIRKIDSLGTQRIPYKTSSHGAAHREASYFVFSFTVPPTKVDLLTEEYSRDIDIIRNRIYKANKEQSFSCTLEEEMKPPPYRQEVIQMIEEGKKKQAKLPKFKYNTGLSYYPFQK